MSAKRKAIDHPGTPSKHACKVLTLAEKIKVIETIEDGLSNVKVASKFRCGCTQVGNIMLNNETAILEAYTNGTKDVTKYLQSRNCMYPQIDTKVWEFHCEARSKNMPVNGGLLKSEALSITKSLNITDFTASNGWLDKFSARHQLRYSVLHGGSAGVDPSTCDKMNAATATNL